MKGVIFDFDGTLYSNQSPLTDFIDKKTADFLIQNKVKDIEHLENKIPNILEALSFLKLSRDNYASFVFNDIHYAEFLQNDSILGALLKKIKCVKIIVSLSPKKHLIKVLEQLGVSPDIFDEIISLCDTPKAIGKKNVYQIIIEKYSLKAEDVICIGNSYELDLIPARQLGMTTFLINKNLDNENIKNFNDIKECLNYLIG